MFRKEPSGQPSEEPDLTHRRLRLGNAHRHFPGHLLGLIANHFGDLGATTTAAAHTYNAEINVLTLVVSGPVRRSPRIFAAAVMITNETISHSSVC